MSELEVEIIIDAPPDVVWAHVEDISTHVDWMQDAEEIRFLSAGRSGIGTRFECDTRVGPIKLTDVMEITEWEPGATMGVKHVGYVTGTGVFTLEAQGMSSTKFRWREQLEFPWFLGGPAGAIVGRPIMAAIWRGNLKRLKTHIESA